MNGKGMLGAVVILLVALVASGSLYTVKEWERGILKQFGRIINADLKPGLGFKVPILHEVQTFDGRTMSLDLRPEEYVTQEKKILIVDSYIMWRIQNIETFYTATGGYMSRAERLLSPVINGKLRGKFGERTVYEVVSGEREQMMLELTEETNVEMQRKLGMEVVDIRVKQIELPAGVSESVYERMRAERQREAREHRSQGKETAEGIRADAERIARIELAEAYKNAEIVQGEGDALAAAIYAEAYGKDPEFYRFSRSLAAYRKAFSQKGDLMVLSPKTEFFDYLKAPLGRN